MSRWALTLPAAACALVPFNSTMVAVAIPSLQREFDASTGQVTTVVTAYLAAMLVTQPLAARAVERMRAASLLRGGLLGVLACSAVAALAPSLAWLALARVGQAVAVACAMTSGLALVRAWSPPERLGWNLGVVTAAIPFGALLGPLVAGSILQVGSWRLCFAANLAILPLLALASPPPVGERPLAASAALPSIPARRMPALGAASAAMGLFNLTMYVLIIVLPLALQSARGWSPLAVGASLAAVPLSSALAAVISGHGVDRRSSRAVALAGGGLVSAGCAALCLGGGELPTPTLAIGVLLVGAGIGVTGAALQAVTLAAVPEARAGTAIGLLSTARYAGAIVGSTAVGALLATVPEPSQVLRACVLAGLAAGLASLLCLWLPRQSVPELARAEEVVIGRD